MELCIASLFPARFAPAIEEQCLLRRPKLAQAARHELLAHCCRLLPFSQTMLCLRLSLNQIVTAPAFLTLAMILHPQAKLVPASKCSAGGVKSGGA